MPYTWKIYKFAWPPTVSEGYPLRFPRVGTSAKILAFGMQEGNPVFWALIRADSDALDSIFVEPPDIARESDRELTIFPTGRTIPPGWTYLGTSQCSKEPDVWHWFEKEL